MKLTKTVLIAIFSFLNLSVYGLSNSSIPRQCNKNLQREIKSCGISSKTTCNTQKYISNPLGLSALSYAIEMKDFKSAKIIASHCNNINQRDPFMKGSSQKITALERLFHHARVKQGAKKAPTEDELQVAYILLERGINVKHGPDVFSPLITACYFGMDDLIVRFTELEINVDDNNGLPLYFLIENGNLKMASYLIENGANINLNHYKLFNAAINSQKLESIDFLIDQGLNISEGHYVRHAFNFLQNEIKNIGGHLHQSLPALEMFCYILEKGANPNSWIPIEGINPTNYEKSIDLCSLQLAFEISSKTNAQHIYKNHVINILLAYGAINPCCLTP